VPKSTNKSGRITAPKRMQG